MVKKDQTDYAAAYRQYCAYGRGRSLKQFCDDENFNYSNLVNMSTNPFGHQARWIETPSVVNVLHRKSKQVQNRLRQPTHLYR